MPRLAAGHFGSGIRGYPLRGLHPAAVAYAALDLCGPHRLFRGAWRRDCKAEPPAGFRDRFSSLGATRVLAGWTLCLRKRLRRNKQRSSDNDCFNIEMHYESPQEQGYQSDRDRNAAEMPAAIATHLRIAAHSVVNT